MKKEDGDEIVEIIRIQDKIRAEMKSHPKYQIQAINGRGKEAYFQVTLPLTLRNKRLKKHFEPFSSDVDRKEYERVEKALDDSRKFFQDNYITKISQLSKKISLINRGINRNAPFLDVKNQEILELLGKFYTAEEVQKFLSEKYSYSVTLPVIRAWAKKNENTIDKIRADYVLKNKDFRIATDTGRLEVLNSILSHWQSTFEKTPSEASSRMILNVLEQGRKEVKGNELHLTVDGKIDINASLQGTDNILEVSKKLPIHMMVVGMVAAKKGVHPSYIQTALANSHYAIHNGFNGKVRGDEDIESPINIIKAYNWGELEEKHRSLKESGIPSIQDANVIEDEDKRQEATDIKNDLMAALKKMKND